MNNSALKNIFLLSSVIFVSTSILMLSFIGANADTRVAYSSGPLEFEYDSIYYGNSDENDGVVAESSVVGTNTGLYDDLAPDLAISFISWFLSILSILALCLIVYGGAIWLLARGNEDEITKAKGILTGAFIGVFIILSSYALTGFVFNSIVATTDKDTGESTACDSNLTSWLFFCD